MKVPIPAAWERMPWPFTVCYPATPQGKTEVRNAVKRLSQTGGCEYRWNMVAKEDFLGEVLMTYIIEWRRRV